MLRQTQELKSEIISQVVLHLKDIIYNPLALDFFSFFFENSSKKERKPLTEKVIENSHFLVMNKHSIKVVLKLGEKGSSIEVKKLIKNIFSEENLKVLLYLELGLYSLNYFLPKMSDKVKAEVISQLEDFEFEKIKIIILGRQLKSIDDKSITNLK